VMHLANHFENGFDRFLGNRVDLGGTGGLGSLFSGFAEGGLISGDGTGTSDSNLARVSDGEFIVNAGATAKHRA
jgi:hypothetical protein